MFIKGLSRRRQRPNTIHSDRKSHSMARLESTDHHDLLAARHPVMTLLSGVNCVFSHCCRIVLVEKDVERSIEYVTAHEYPSKLGELNPYGETPTLVDRGLTLYGTSVIIEYLDERFPHPPLLPVAPVERAKTRLMISRLTRDWLCELSKLEQHGATKPPTELCKRIHDGLLALTPLFAHQSFFLGDEYTMADAFITPLLWRLPALGIHLPKQAAPLLAYADRIFNRPAFAESLSHQEAEIR